MIRAFPPSGPRAMTAGIACLAALMAFAAPVALAQKETGDGFLFEKPQGTLSFRAGYSRASASGDLYALQRKQLTIGPRGFDALSLGADVSVNATRRIDLGLSLDGTVRSHQSEYRGWLDQNDKPIEQMTNLSTVAISAVLKYNLRDRGRLISTFAWIPAQYVPYVGIGGGVMTYEFNQKGDFVDASTTVVSSDELDASSWTAMAQVFTGVSYTLTPRWSLLSEARYTRSSAKLNRDYSDLGRIDLSGVSLNFGTSVRF